MYKTLINILPGRLKKKIFNIARKGLSGYWTDLDKVIPRYKLNEIHISNLKVLVSREKMLEMFPKNGIVAEIGVDKGEFSEKIFNIASPKKLHLVDIWDSERYPKALHRIVEELFAEEIKNARVEINLGLSTTVVNTFDDSYFDWIYIDTDHTYATTRSELEMYSKKIKPGGIIAGHDYIQGNWNGMARYGVIEAVYEFCVKNSWEIIYLSMEIDHAPSFAIRKIKRTGGSND
jgi:hypothetical protein